MSVTFGEVDDEYLGEEIPAQISVQVSTLKWNLPVFFRFVNFDDGDIDNVHRVYAFGLQ